MENNSLCYGSLPDLRISRFSLSEPFIQLAASSGMWMVPGELFHPVIQQLWIDSSSVVMCVANRFDYTARSWRSIAAACNLLVTSKSLGIHTFTFSGGTVVQGRVMLILTNS